MKWTNETPKYNGWYWYRAAPDTPKTVVHALYEDGRFIVAQGAEEFFPADYHKGAQFAGPIPQPEN